MFNSEMFRTMKYQDYDIHRRKIVITEDEHRVAQEKERIAITENRNKSLEMEYAQTCEELKLLKKKHEKTHGEFIEMQQQMRILNENLRRETEVCMSREKENITIQHESKTLKDMITEYKSQMGTYKED